MGVNLVEWQGICSARAVTFGLKATQKEPIEREMRPDVAFVVKPAPKKNARQSAGRFAKNRLRITSPEGQAEAVEAASWPSHYPWLYA